MKDLVHGSSSVPTNLAYLLQACLIDRVVDQSADQVVDQATDQVVDQATDHIITIVTACQSEIVGLPMSVVNIRVILCKQQPLGRFKE